MRAVRALLIFLVGAVVSLAVTYMAVLRPRIKTWGVDPTETEAALPGDDLISEPMATETRGVTIDAPVAQVWPWLVQMGFGRAGWYSFDSMDRRYKSADSILPEFQKIEPGEIMPLYAGGGFEVRTVDPEHALVLFADQSIMTRQAQASGLMADVTNGEGDGGDVAMPKGQMMRMSPPPDFSASWAFILKPTDDGQTRLIERFRVKAESRMPANAVMQEMMSTGLVLMARKQMLGIKDRAERPASEQTAAQTDHPTGAHEPQIDIPALSTTDTATEPSAAN
jgi:hypothetical protein